MNGRRRHHRRIACLALASLTAAGFALLSGCAAMRGAANADRAAESGVEGTVYAPAEGVYLYVYKKGMGPYGPAHVILPAPTTRNGNFSVTLPPGEYTVVARRRASEENTGPMAEGDLRSDPVSVTVAGKGKVSVPILMNVKEDAEIRAFQPPAAWNTAIRGKVVDAEGVPVSGARVHVYTYVQMSERPKYVSERTGPDGSYIVYLPKGGTYYLAARNRFGGPPRIGDLYGRYDEGSIDPASVVVKDGETRKEIDIIVFKVW